MKKSERQVESGMAIQRRRGAHNAQKSSTVSTLHCHSSWVKILNSVTTLRLTCFDHWFSFYDPFITNIAPKSLTEVPAFFVTQQYQRWPLKKS